MNGDVRGVVTVMMREMCERENRAGGNLCVPDSFLRDPTARRSETVSWCIEMRENDVEFKAMANNATMGPVTCLPLVLAVRFGMTVHGSWKETEDRRRMSCGVYYSQWYRCS